MKVNANITQLVTIDPKDVISNLISEALGSGQDVKEKDGSYYLVVYSSHTEVIYGSISKEKYDYINALKLVLGTLTK